MSENGEIYTAGKNFTVTALTNSNSDDKDDLDYHEAHDYQGDHDYHEDHDDPYHCRSARGPRLIGARINWSGIFSSKHTIIMKLYWQFLLTALTMLSSLQ